MNKIRLPKQLFNLSLGLLIVFILIVLWEGYLLYSLFNNQLFGADTDLIAGSVIRLDLNSYNKTLTELDAEKNYTPPPLSLVNPDPFK